MLGALTLILVCQLAGEVLVGITGLPVPGPVAGMLLLLAGLFARGRVDDGLDTTATGLLSHLSLLFVPAGVGVMVHWESLRSGWVALGLALVLSTLIGLVVTALVMQGVQGLMQRRGQGHE